MFRNYFKIIQSFIHGNSFAEDDSNYVQKSNTNFCLILENIKFSHIWNCSVPRYYGQYKKNSHLFRTHSYLHSYILHIFICFLYLSIFLLLCLTIIFLQRLCFLQ